MFDRRTEALGFVCSLIIGVAVLLYLSIVQVGATAGISLTTSPVSADLSTEPGTSSTTTLQVMNNTSKPLPIAMQLRQFGPYGSSGQAAITDIPSNSPEKSWVTFSPSSFTAQPGVWTQVKMKLSLPPTAQLGYYFVAVFKPLIPVPPPPASSSQATVVRGSNAVLVLVDTHSANERRVADIAKFSVNKHLFEYLPAKFTVTIHNIGNIYLPVTGNIFISRHASMVPTIDSLAVNSGGGNVLPSSERTFNAAWSDGFPVFEPKLVNNQTVTDPKGAPIQELSWDFSNANKLRFGKYYAKLSLIYNDGTREVPVTGFVSFWVIPWKMLLVLLLIIVLLVIGSWTLGLGGVHKIKGIYRK